MRRRILASTIGVALVAVVLFGVPLAVAAGRLYRSQEITRLQKEASRVGGSLPPAGLRPGVAVVLPHPPAPVVLALYDAAGKLVVGTGPVQGGSEVLTALGGRAGEVRDGPWLAVAIPVTDENRIIGAGRAAVPWSTVEHRADITWVAMAGLGLLAGAVATALALWQARGLTRPIADVAVVAERLGQGDFAARLGRYGIAEIDRAGEALNATAGRLGDRIERERAFSADASHQLSTPLTGLRLTLESALVTPGVDERATISEAVEQVDRLQRTITTLLSMARDMVAGDEVCDVVAVCREVADWWRGPLAAAGRSIRLDLPTVPLSSAACPAEVLREILQVLLDNASTHGRGTVTLRARYAITAGGADGHGAGGAGVVVEVGDEGDGITPSAGDIFRRRSSAATGHGIGLALARSLAEAGGGRLQLARARPPLFTVTFTT